MKKEIGIITFFLAVGAGAATQNIKIAGNHDFFAVELVVGANTVAELFPTAPARSVIFTYDNAAGFLSSTKLSTGWTDPNLTIAPGQGAIFVSPVLFPQSLEFTLTGTAPASEFPLYSGWNLIAASSVRFPLEPVATGSPDGDRVISKPSIGPWETNHFNGTLNEWEPSFTPASGEGVWFHTDAWPPNPSGTFSLRPAVLLNNIYRVSPLQTRDLCSPTTEGVLHFFILTDQGRTRTKLAEAPIEISRDGTYHVLDGEPITYLPFEATERRIVFTNDLWIVVDGEATGNTCCSGEFAETLIPFYRLAMYLRSSAPAAHAPFFIQQPQSSSAEIGGAAQLEAIFNTAGNPQPTLSIETTSCGEETECEVFYQWQKKVGMNRWQDVPGATTDTFTLANIQPAQFGTYRLRASWGECHEAFSHNADVGPAPVFFDVHSVESTSTVHLTASTSEELTAIVESSSDLAVWTEVAQKNVFGQWTYTAPKADGSQFFRVNTIPVE